MRNYRLRAKFVLPRNLTVHSGRRLARTSQLTSSKLGRLLSLFRRSTAISLFGLVCWAAQAGIACPAAAASSGTLAFSPASLNFGSVDAGGSKTLSVAITNTGESTVTFAAESLVANNYAVTGFSLPSSIAAGHTLTVSVRFAPAKQGTAAGYIRFNSNASNASVEYELTGTGVANTATTTVGAELTPTPTTANLGSAPVGATNSQVIQLKNTGSTTLSISGATLSGSSEFKSCQLKYPLSLGAGQTTNCTIQFTPSATGNVFASLIFTSNGTDKTLIIALSGEGVAATRTLAATPTSLNFGNVGEGKSQKLAVVLKNTGNSSVTVSTISTSGTTLTTSGGVSGATIAPGQSATVDVTYSPVKIAALGGAKVTIASNATGSPTQIPVFGAGIAASTTHEVTLSWKASVSSGIAGYNVYRATLPSGSYVKLTSTVIAGTSFSDTDVTAGDTYSYEVTAVNQKGEESAPSARTSAVIP
jgi:hypothetical protein